MRDHQFGFAATVSSSFPKSNLKLQFDIDIRCTVRINYRRTSLGSGMLGINHYNGAHADVR
jgi:hypothetical protein